MQSDDKSINESINQRYLSSGNLLVDCVDESAYLNGEKLTLVGKPFALLVFLMRANNQLVTKDQLIEELWDGRAVSEAVITTAIRQLRRALGESRHDTTYVETVHRRGYRFLLPVVGSDEVLSSSEQDDSSTAKTWGIKRSIAVCLFVLVTFAAAAVVFNLGGINDLWRATSAPGVAYVTIEEASGDDTVDQLANSFRDIALTSSWFVSERDNATFQIAVTRATDVNDDVSSVFLKFGYRDKEISSIPVQIKSEQISSSANKALKISEHILRCHKEIADMASEPTRVSDAFKKMVIVLCDQSRGQIRPRQFSQLTEQLWKSFPNEQTLKALHLIILATRPGYHVLARADVYDDAYFSEIKALSEDLQKQEDKTPLVGFSLQLADAVLKGSAETALILTKIPPSRWLGTRTGTRLATLYRFAGRLREAEHLLRNLMTSWPDAKHLHLAHTLTQLMAGGLKTAKLSLNRAVEVGAIPDRSPMVLITYLLYGSIGEAETVVRKGVPNAILPCLEEFVGRRNGSILGGELNKTECSRLGPVHFSRMLAVLDHREQALGLVRTFEASAIGPALTLHYPEYRAYWRDGSLIEEARRFGMIDFWRQTGILPDYCTVGGFEKLCEANSTAE